MEEFEAKDNAVVVEKAEGKQQFFGGTHTHNWGNQSQKTTTSTNLITLPPNLDNWVERKEEIEIIEVWLNNSQFSTVGITQANTLGIQGLGGVGKSTLAAHFYHSLDFDAKFWADVSLKPDFTVFAEKIILALGGKVTLPIDIMELTNNLLQLLSQHRCLLVVDNLETLLDEERNWQDKYYQQFFSLWLNNGTNSTLFITTQDKPQLFQGLQHWHPLGGMKIEEGIALLNKLAIQGTEAELKAFVEYVDGHPLTIKLVAGFLREYCDSKLSQVTELELEQFDLAYQEAEGSHRSKQDARLSWIIQQHLDRLNPEQTQLLTNLSVYRLPFNREAARYMLVEKEIKKFIIQKKLKELCNRSLLTELQDKKFQFESLVQKYVLQQANDLTNAHQQAIEYYQANLKCNLKEPESWKSLVLEDVSEYLEIIDHRCELKQYAEANKVLDSCYGFLDLRGYYGVLVEIYDKLVQGWQSNLQPEDRSDYAWAFNHLGIAYNFLGEYQLAIDFSQYSLEIQQQIGARHGEASSLNNLASVYYFLGEYRQTIDFLQKSLKIKNQIGDLNGELSSLNNLASTYNSLGEHQKAIDYHQKLLKISQQIRDVNREGASLTNLGNSYNALGEYQTAIDYLQQSLEIQQRIGARNGEAASLTNLGNSYNALGEYQTAIDYLQKSLKISQQISNCYGEAICLNNLGNSYNALGEYKIAIGFHEQSLKIKQQIGDRHGEAASLNNLGNSYNALEKYRIAIDYLQKSLKISQQIRDRHGEAESLNNLGSVCNHLEEYQQAIRYFQQSLAITQKIGNLNEEANSLIGLGRICNHLEEYQQAIDYYQQSLKIQQQIGDRHGEAISLRGLGNVYKSLGEYPRAIDYLQQSLAITEEIGDRRGKAESLCGLGSAYNNQEEYQGAIDYLQKSLQISQQIGTRDVEAESWFNLGDTRKNLQQKSEAKTAYENSRKLYQAMELDKKVEECNKAIQDLENNDID